MLRRLVFPLFLVHTLLIAAAEDTEHPQDVSSIRQAYATKGPTPGSAHNRLTLEGETPVAVFNTRYQADYCLSFGPSTAMPSIHGNPLEITHSDQRITMVPEPGQIGRIHQSNDRQVTTRPPAKHS
ncbi:MAG: hypothetical protein V4628_10460 [Pseudomonadota bacterium]